MKIAEWIGTQNTDAAVKQTLDWIVLLDGKVQSLAADQDEGLVNEPVEMGLMNLDEAQRSAFFTWLNEDVNHQYLFAEYSELWAKTSCIKSLTATIHAANVVQFGSGQHSNDLHSLESIRLMADYSCSAAAPEWAYKLVIGLIAFGMVVPFFL